ncbi:MAG: A/G-specific adenine glycosylase [Anaerolineae bacterium UTCFX2]|nr:A/G-specific adenine glycosylase [Anaerolineales bacterium]OQY87471.1 MAG: A/G-specific adenine glycosylase [Anaerolineae bacterium UTCFX2]
MTGKEFPVLLLDWYSKHARPLPWRRNPEPYAVWVSEIMLQQTRVETVLPYFERWMERFPNLPALAEAPLQAVLTAWEGLGYYSRARNLHAAAKIVMTKYVGQIPEQPAELAQLPGIGCSTAGAIASIAFGVDAPVLDGNIRRVLARVFDVSEPARSPAGEARLWDLARDHLPAGKAGDYNQASMDLGARVCTPRRPDCPNCPLREVCLANLRGVQSQRPAQLKRARPPHYTVAAAVICHAGQMLIAQRPTDKLLGGLWEFPGGKLLPGESLIDGLKREICEELGSEIEVGDLLGVYRHAYTHFKVTLHAFHCRLGEGDHPHPFEAQALRWVGLDRLDDFPMGKIDRQIARDLQSLETRC